MSIESKLAKLNLTLPEGSPPAANYRNTIRWKELVFVSGKAAQRINGVLPEGKLGREFNVEQGKAFAQSAVLDILAALRQEIGCLDNIAQIIELQGFVNATEDFTQHAEVLNGASNLLVALFGDAGMHSRSVLGAASLRGNTPVILKATVAVKETEK
jgi:enamine deaminase RidA (YjgF/YER057c/UK114 family)